LFDEFDTLQDFLSEFEFSGLPLGPTVTALQSFVIFNIVGCHIARFFGCIAERAFSDIFLQFFQLQCDLEWGETFTDERFES
jgi:hypothetical protein